MAAILSTENSYSQSNICAKMLVSRTGM